MLSQLIGVRSGIPEVAVRTVVAGVNQSEAVVRLAVFFPPIVALDDVVVDAVVMGGQGGLVDGAVVPIEPARHACQGDLEVVAVFAVPARDVPAGKRALMGDRLDFLRASNPLDWPRMAALVEHLGLGGELAAGVLSSRANTVLNYEPLPEINADSEEAEKLLREEFGAEEAEKIMREVKEPRGHG